MYVSMALTLTTTMSSLIFPQGMPLPYPGTSGVFVHHPVYASKYGHAPFNYYHFDEVTHSIIPTTSYLLTVNTYPLLPNRLICVIQYPVRFHSFLKNTTHTGNPTIRWCLCHTGARRKGLLSPYKI